MSQGVNLVDNAEDVFLEDKATEVLLQDNATPVLLQFSNLDLDFVLRTSDGSLLDNNLEELTDNRNG